jgi:hypothetical protein
MCVQGASKTLDGVSIARYGGEWVYRWTGKHKDSQEEATEPTTRGAPKIFRYKRIKSSYGEIDLLNNMEYYSDIDPGHHTA